METQSLTRDVSSLIEFPIGTPVIYGLLGKCSVTAIESRQVGNQAIRCYRLEVQKSALSRSTRTEPAIWLPINAAQARGLRSPMLTATESEAVFAVLASREYYFNLQETWSIVYPKLEATIRAEGSIGLAKVYSYLIILKRRQVVASSEVAKFLETVSRLLFRELSDLLGETAKALEEKAAKTMKNKLLADH